MGMYIISGTGLEWRAWDDVYIVYQCSSAETHVFNETTALILRCLESGPLSANDLQISAESELGLLDGEHLADGDFTFATMRLEELGIIEYLDGSCVIQ